MVYCHEFIPQFASHSTHPTEAPKKSSPTVIWMDNLQKEFSDLKSCLCAEPCLVFPLPLDLFTLQTDASGVRIGSALLLRELGLNIPWLTLAGTHTCTELYSY